MPNAESADPYALQDAGALGIDDGLPALLTSVRSAPGTMYEIQIDICEPALV